MRESEGTGLSESAERAVRAELNRLLGGVAFRNSKRCSEFLQYVVEHTISGASGSLKERSIGVELFHLPPDFDPGQHTIVRVRDLFNRRQRGDGTQFRWKPAERAIDPTSPA